MRAIASAAAVAARLRAAGCVFAEEEAAMLLAAARTPAELAALVDRRVAGLPLEHVLGWAEFAGLRVEVDPGVFVPRRRSEFLVALAVRLGRDLISAGAAVPSGTAARPAPVIVDLCCGCGAIGAAIAVALETSELHAADIDPVAVACARRNLARIGGQAYQGDLFAPLPGRLRGSVDLLAVNAPYVPTSEISLMPAEARLHEPRVALDGGPDGVDLHRRVAAEAASWLAPSGRLLIETSARQAPLTVAAVQTGGLTAEVVADDDLDATVVIGSASLR